MGTFEILSLGDSAVLLRSSAGIEIDPLIQMRDRIAAEGIAGVTEVVIGYASIALFVDPNAAESVRTRVAGLLAAKGGAAAKSTAGRIIGIPVCYDAEFAPDLSDVARHCGISHNEVVERHAAGEYRVRCIGFTPGFPYLSGLPEVLAMPRRASPRTKIPAGSVAIGGLQTGIYPTVSPGGWNVIGRTPLRLLDAEREPYEILRAGDRVRFRAITHAEFIATNAQ